MQQADIVIIGGGIAGAAAGFALASSRRVILLERESQPGYHSTGRSAALFTEAYGNSAIRALTIASRAFFMAPPPGFAEHQLLTPRGVVMVGRADQKERFERALEEAHRHVKNVARLTLDEVFTRLPVMRRDYATDGFVEPEAMDIDVHAVHRGYLRGLTAQGGRIVTDAEVTGLSRDGNGWRVATRAGDSRRRSSSMLPARGATRWRSWPASRRSGWCRSGARRSPSIRPRACRRTPGRR